MSIKKALEWGLFSLLDRKNACISQEEPILKKSEWISSLTPPGAGVTVRFACKKGLPRNGASASDRGKGVCNQ